MAIEHGIACRAIADALIARLTRYDEAGPAGRFRSALRNKFGGHDGVPRPGEVKS